MWLWIWVGVIALSLIIEFVTLELDLAIMPNAYKTFEHSMNFPMELKSISLEH